MKIEMSLIRALEYVILSIKNNNYANATKLLNEIIEAIREKEQEQNNET